MLSRFITIFLCISLWSQAVYAQASQREVATQFNAWYMYFGTYRFSEAWSVHSEFQLRRSGILEDPQQFLGRIGLNYHVNESLMLSGGYAYIITSPYGEQPVLDKFPEHRLWQQLVFNQKIGKAAINHRYRLEQRWLDLPTTEENDYTYLNRARYRLMVNIPLNSATISKGTLFISVYDEVMINFGKNSGKNIFDQNRIYGALGYQISPSANVQVGYLNQYIQKPDGLRFEQNNTFQLAVFHNLDLR